VVIAFVTSIKLSYVEPG